MFSGRPRGHVYPAACSIEVIPSPGLLSKKTPHPTRERGAGQRTDLVFPSAREDDERGGGA